MFNIRYPASNLQYYRPRSSLPFHCHYRMILILLFLPLLYALCVGEIGCSSVSSRRFWLVVALLCYGFQAWCIEGMGVGSESGTIGLLMGCSIAAEVSAVAVVREVSGVTGRRPPAPRRSRAQSGCGGCIMEEWENGRVCVRIDADAQPCISRAHLLMYMYHIYSVYILIYMRVYTFIDIHTTVCTTCINEI